MRLDQANVAHLSLQVSDVYIVVPHDLDWPMSPMSILRCVLLMPSPWLFPGRRTSSLKTKTKTLGKHLPVAGGYGPVGPSGELLAAGPGESMGSVVQHARPAPPPVPREGPRRAPVAAPCPHEGPHPFHLMTHIDDMKLWDQETDPKLFLSLVDQYKSVLHVWEMACIHGNRIALFLIGPTPRLPAGGS